MLEALNLVFEPMPGVHAHIILDVKFYVLVSQGGTVHLLATIREVVGEEEEEEEATLRTGEEVSILIVAVVVAGVEEGEAIVEAEQVEVVETVIETEGDQWKTSRNQTLVRCAIIDKLDRQSV